MRSDPKLFRLPPKFCVDLSSGWRVGMIADDQEVRVGTLLNDEVRCLHESRMVLLRGEARGHTDHTADRQDPEFLQDSRPGQGMGERLALDPS